MIWPTLLALLLQVSPVPNPVPPPPASPGTEAFARERDAYADRLRRDCLSEAGVRIAIEHWTEGRASAPVDRMAARSVDRELAEAALTPPIDLARLERALAADRQVQVRFFEDVNRRSMAVMRQLSPADRVIYARRLTTARPAVPPRRCEPGRP